MFSNDFMRYMYGTTSPIDEKEKFEKQKENEYKKPFVCFILKCSLANK